MLGHIKTWQNARFERWTEKGPSPLRWLLPLSVIPLGIPNTETNRRGTGQGDDVVSPATIDPLVLPLVRALNATDFVTTRASCEGHWSGLYRLEQAYVLFDADFRYVEELAEQIRNETFHQFWEIVGRYTVERRMQYRLSTSVHNLPLADLYPWERRAWWAWYRARLREDLAKLCVLAEKATHALDKTQKLIHSLECTSA